jgi:DNA-binding response OmpR family regulator
MSIDETTTEIEQESGRPKILVVDDTDFLRELFEASLRRAGYSVDTAEDGRKALELYRAQKPPYGLVITDFQMPGMNGIRFAKEIRANGNGVPIVLSSGTNVGDEAEWRGAGIAGLLPKPFNYASLVSCVQQHYKG